MAQFDVYHNPDPDTRSSYPYFVDLQADIIGDLTTRVVAPLVARDEFRYAPLQILCPEVAIDNEIYVVMTHQLASIPMPVNLSSVASLQEQRYELLNALDFLITGC
ncbi:CcdB family protein [Pseudidiomarina homiensis]|uniref:CcdB family protein n=1 Tax=Pseudidiomarina homiensis TaxID=364198 RepID=UPI00215A26BB|nr:CcdB family protein [Pseudidiomarina homiensis]